MKWIKIHGAAENNLKDIDLQIPQNRLTVISGLSGSGKSSLVRDVLQREGQRMYLETFSAYNRSKLGKIRPAKVKYISGLLPVISVGQTYVQANRRSTAGTFSDVSPLLRQLFSRFNDQKMKISRNTFSFNSEKGWCGHCKGLGIEEFIDVNKLVTNPKKSLREGALVITLPNGYTIYSQVTIDELEKVCSHEGFSVDTPWINLTDSQRDVVMNGSENVKVLYGKHSLESRMKWTGMTARPREEGYYKGILPVMEDILKRDRNDNILRFVSSKTCSKCGGERLNSTARSLTWQNLHYAQLEAMSFNKILNVLQSADIQSAPERVLVNALINRFEQLCQLSVGHIAPNRESETLSQGELRRMRLAQLNHSGLTGVLYLFDEPSIGLHMRDIKSLVETFYKLVNNGNTVIVVEHNEAIIQSAQYLIELGPRAGKYGGELIFSGSLEIFAQNPPPRSLLSKSLYTKEKVNTTNTEDCNPKTFSIHIKHAHNIYNQNFTFARQKLNVITGVSGAGKSTLVAHGLLATNAFDQIVFIDQKPIGRTSRSNPATYTGLFDELRKLFANTPEAKALQFKAGHFSFNNKQGQCEACQGTGVIKTGMHIFEDLIQECPVCKGSRYKPEIMNVKFKGKSIHKILSMSVNEAYDFLYDFPKVAQYLEAMKNLGLGYLHLGQSSTTLSGGEAQRIKLASSLYAVTKQPTLYVLDEPTTGLHSSNIQMLLKALRMFIEKGHTIVLVEHDAQVIKNADWIVDVGPEGGEGGGKELFCGSISTFLAEHSSPTTQSLLAIQPPPSAQINESQACIHLEGLCTNNLKNINLHIAAGKMVAFTGMSGSGKTSLLIDTLHSEGQRLFMENMSSYHRLQIKAGTSAKVHKMISMMPTIAVTADEQKPDIRSTLASLSGIYDLLRLLYARFASNPAQLLVSAADFSLVNEHSVCKSCEGTGFEKKCLPEEIIVDNQKSLFNGALTHHKTAQYFISSQNKFRWIVLAMCNDNQIDIGASWSALSKLDQQKILFGTADRKYQVNWAFDRKNNKGNHHFEDVWPGLCNLIEEEYRMHFPSTRGKNALELLNDVPCTTCNGYRLNPQMLGFTFEGKHMGEMLQMNVQQCLQMIESTEINISTGLKQQLTNKLSFLANAGLAELPLGKPAVWLSTGELKWVKLCSILSSTLSGMCIILDEPAAGMDEKGCNHLVEALKAAKERGNTILVSDHNKELVLAADQLIELGPGAGQSGGQIVANVTPNEIEISDAEIAKLILKNSSPQIEAPRNIDAQMVQIMGHSFLLNRINIICGAIGSGKTTLLKGLFKQMGQQLEMSVIFAQSKTLHGNKNSTVATRTHVLNDLKKQFADLVECKNAGLKAADFGFNNKKSQCSVCKGSGIIVTSLDFMPDVKEVCQECNGNRYANEILQYQFKDRNIAEWLHLTIDEMVTYLFWSAVVQKELRGLQQVGLGYLSTDRDISTLSQGEQRRFSLAEQIRAMKENPTVILFDNPTHGLDPISIQKLMKMFDVLIKSGHTIIAADEKRVGAWADCIITL